MIFGANRMAARPSLTVSIALGLCFFAILCLSCGSSGQRADMSFRPKVGSPAFPAGEGPLVLLDEAHGNFHKLDGRYRPFAALLREDGYTIEASGSPVRRPLLDTCRIFVSSVPTSKEGRSAFSSEEIDLLQHWVGEGGSLLLVTDHMPDPPAIAGLATAFGITVNNGYVMNETPGEDQGPIFFRRSDGTLADHPVTGGRSESEQVGMVVSFTGCAFQASDAFTPILTFGPLKVSWMTDEEGKFPPDTPKLDVEGWYQGAVAEYGEGRIAFFGEAAMFTAQVIEGRGNPFGMHSPIAPENAQFLLNVMHWLSGII